MSGISFPLTAPSISLREEIDEVENLSEWEKIELELMAEGKRVAAEETPENIQRGLTRMKNYLEAMDIEEKRSYMEACDICPDVVEHETGLIKFLRAADYKPNTAAIQLVKHWDMRVSVFGGRAFFPMRLYNGVFEPGDLEALKGCWGNIVHLPPDRHGRGVLLVDRSKFDNHKATRKQMMKLCIYVTYVVAEDESYQKKGAIVLVSPSNADSQAGIDRKLIKFHSDYTQSCFPLRLEALHHADNSVLLGIVLQSIKKLFGSFIRLRARFHSGTHAQVRRTLEKFGFQKNGLPDFMGGGFSFNEKKWIEERLRKEQLAC